jgi:SAM-dependent methyltransferase
VFGASAHVYDLIYQSFKDYGAESARIAALLKTEQPAARRLLDVACGTGEHARHLIAGAFQVDGIDLDPNLLAIAARKNPTGRFVQADMCSFQLGRTYDVVLCLFSSIGYAVTLERTTAALRCFRAHLGPGGLVVVEPWFAPDALTPGRTDTQTIDQGTLRVTRRSRVEIEGRVSSLTFEYDITENGASSQATEIHELGLFTRAEMEGAFTAAGLTTTYDPVGLSGRGLYLARGLSLTPSSADTRPQAP